MTPRTTRRGVVIGGRPPDRGLSAQFQGQVEHPILEILDAVEVVQRPAVRNRDSHISPAMPGKGTEKVGGQTPCNMNSFLANLLRSRPVNGCRQHSQA